MLITVIATVCLLDACKDVVVTDQATLMQCGGSMALQVIPHWMDENGYSARGYRLAAWGCSIGGARKPVL